MENYIKIQTVYRNDDERTVEKLSRVYADVPLLKDIISKLICEDLDGNLIKNKNVLIKPNWVCHSSKSSDDVCLRTHDNFLLAALEIILAKKPNKVMIGDAPIQGCDWSKMLSRMFYRKLDELSCSYSIPIEIKDFRLVTLDPKTNISVKERHPLSEYIIFDVGKNSFLEEISSSGKNKFRVTCYDPDRLAQSHRPGVHKYCITKELFDADIIISIPKIKTHQKAGLTAALKNLVGLNGSKDYLPHHRIGGVGFGGDCYPGKNYLRLWSELSLDNANRSQSKPIYSFWKKLSSLLWRLSAPKKVHNIAAGWHGNDTTWRMVMDINLIALFGKNDGTLAKEQQRFIYNLCDGIIAGQGNGPLKPEPLPLGIVSFSNDPALTDICMAKLMGFEINKVPLLKIAMSALGVENERIYLNGAVVPVEKLSDYSVSAILPSGWVDYMKGVSA